VAPFVKSYPGDRNVTESSDERSSMAIAMDWVSRVTTVSVEMVLPCLAGRWVDERLGSGPLFTLLGGVFGLVGGMWHLIQMTKPRPNGSSHGK